MDKQNQETKAKKWAEACVGGDLEVVSKWTNWYAFRQVGVGVFVITWNVMYGIFQIVQKPNCKIMRNLGLVS